MANFTTHIVFGQRYRDRYTSFEGVADGAAFYEHGCTRIRLVSLVDKKPLESWCDEPVLELIDSKSMGFRS